MNYSYSQNITIKGGMPPMMPMGGWGTPMITTGMPIGMGMGPIPMIGGYYGGMNNDIAAGYAVGSMISNPWLMSGIGKACSWTFNNVLKPVGKFMWNGVMKPVGNFVWNNVMKPIGRGCKWLWDNTIGRLSHKKDKKDTAKAEG